MSKTQIPVNSQEVHAISCLLIAAKAVELDDKIPYISKLVRFCDKNVKIDDIKQAERTILEVLDWDLQTCTIVDLLEFYLSQGILFSTDELNENLPLKVLNEKDGNLEIKKTKTGKKISFSESWVKMESLGEASAENVAGNAETMAYSLLMALLKGNFLLQILRFLPFF